MGGRGGSVGLCSGEWEESWGVWRLEGGGSVDNDSCT